MPFYDQVVSELKNSPSIGFLAKKYGPDLDEHISNTSLERGQRYCESRLLGLLYTYRYAPMHYAALVKVMPDETFDTILDFGGGPGTAMLAVAESQRSTFDRISLEHAAGMRKVSELAHHVVRAQCKLNVEIQMPGQQFWKQVEEQTHEKRTLLVFSYFFAQELSLPFVRALSERIAGLRASQMTVLYTNPVRPAASWMPNGGIHDWYCEFSRSLGHTPRILKTSYTYRALKNLSERVNRSGECAFETWRLR